MAFSQPTDEAQTPAGCQLCEESSDIRWKCINCDVFMCQLCTTKIHTKLKSTGQHELINLKEFGSEDVAKAIRKVNLQNMPCTVHNDQMCCAFCTDCDQPICMDCLIQSHEKHKFRKLNEVYESRISEMKDLQNKFKSSEEFFCNEKERLEKLLVDGDKSYQELKDKILQKEKEIIETVSKYAKELLEELELIWKPTENKIKTELSVTKKTKEDLIAREEHLKKTLQSHQTSEILSSSRKTLDITLPEQSGETIKYEILNTKFLSGKILEKQNTRSTIFGDFYAVPDFELVKSYQSDFSNIWDILNCDSSTSFISCSREVKVQKVKFEENNIKVEEDINISVRDMTKLKNDGILLSTMEGDIKMYSIDKELKLFKSFSPLKAISVHVSRNNKIFVGLTESTTVTNPAGVKSGRKVAVLNLDGNIRHTYEYDKDNQRLFTEPRRIVTLNDNIYVIDCVNEQWEGRVMGFEYGGQLLWSYKGVDNHVNKGKFHPTDITITSSNYILISDQHNHALNVLNSAGDVIVCKDIKSLGIELPLSLSIDSNRILWIGCNTRAAKKDDKAKIFAVKMV